AVMSFADGMREPSGESWQGLRAPVDGRQSENALRIARGVRRLLRATGYATLTEMPRASGRRADVTGLGADGTLVIVEVKSSLADFRA
ncbi:MmcB family DNA repair protein, partial [Flavonifractor plautii]|uniref:MmcB family DNA repair protein n=1 Tax=Flavonifractor plautii TaxID=292800 RepID=UPI001D0971EF